MRDHRQARDNEPTPRSLAQIIMRRADVLGAISEEPGRLTRRFATPAMRQANDLVAGWMRDAGMVVRVDNIGNLIGRFEGVDSSEGARTLVLGSHLDTVRDAGKYDGPLGVLVALACVERLHALKKRLPFAIEIIAFAGEEGSRYGAAYLGSKVYAGVLDPQCLELADEDNVVMRDALRAFSCDPAALSQDKCRVDNLLGYCEVHIEQGPVLEKEGMPVGIVSAIAGQTRVSVSFTGEAGHAGTVPMQLRRDALCAAAEFVLAVEQYASSQPGLVATVGQLSVQPGTSNVIPGGTTLSLDVRHAQDAVRQQAISQLREYILQISAQRRAESGWKVLQETPAIACSLPQLEGLARAVTEVGQPVRYLPSGAGHDAVIMSEVTPVAMLFVRCKGGVSHNPAESVEVGDVAVAIEVMVRFLETLAQGDGA